MAHKVFYGVYDTKNFEQCVGIFESAKELAKYFNSTENSMWSSITRKRKIKNRYIVFSMKEE